MTDHDPRPSWTPPTAPLYPYGPPPPYGPAPIEVRVEVPVPAGRGLAITGVVLGGLALLAMVLVGLFVVALAFVGLDDGVSNSCGYGPVRGTIAPDKGTALAGAALAAEVTTKVTDDCGEPESIVCPATEKVAQDVTTVCHGTDLGEDATFVVFFEDASGDYTLLEI